ncbi:MAG: hypothetical protein ABIN23_08075, partial [candidate division WOR-3 bacterium]
VGKAKLIISLSPQEVKPYYSPIIPKQESQTTITIYSVTPKNNVPIPYYPVKLWAKRINRSGGHDHDTLQGGGPVGVFTYKEGFTNEIGKFVTTYTASEFGGIERIFVCGNISLPTDTSYEDLTVRIPGLVLLPDEIFYEKAGGTQYHQGAPDDHNHWGKNYLIDAIYAIALNYVNRGGEIIRINDISLPYGGEFDICGTWNHRDGCDIAPDGGHSTHRIGENADIRGRGGEGRFRMPGAMERIIREVARAFNLSISYPWEGNHYHFTIRPRR